MELKILAVTFALAFLTETLVEYLAGTPMDRIEKLRPYRWLLIYISAGVGVGLALFYSLDVIALIARIAPVQAVISLDEPSIPGMVLTGLAVGRGANYLSDFLSKYLKPRLPQFNRPYISTGPKPKEIPY